MADLMPEGQRIVEETARRYSMTLTQFAPFSKPS